MMDEVQITSIWIYIPTRPFYLYNNCCYYYNISCYCTFHVESVLLHKTLGKGVIEVDSELMWVDSVDRVANTATIAPYWQRLSRHYGCYSR
jgi:hypothetical protein